MNILANSRVYLCGQVEHDTNAAGWRKEIATGLISIEPTLKIWDPLIKPEWLGQSGGPINDGTIDPSDPRGSQRLDMIAYGYKDYVMDPSDPRGLQCLEANRRVRAVCKQLANKCDFIIARISKTFTWGSIDELEIAISRHIPIFLWLPDGMISIYGIAGCTYQRSSMQYYIHSDMDSLLGTLAEINSGDSDLPARDPEAWLYLTWKNAGEPTCTQQK